MSSSCTIESLARGWELRQGLWQDCLTHVECDALIVDAPYSERTHAGHDTSASGRAGAGNDGADRSVLSYRAWRESDVEEFVRHWDERTRGWFVTITDHTLAWVWAQCLEDMTNRYVFSPLSFVAPGSRVRIGGDGPAQWSCSIVVARPASLSKWGSLPGAYVLPKSLGEVECRNVVMGGKPLWLMKSLVRDYSRVGDLVCDPCAGGGTTLLAAVSERRRAIGAESLPEHYSIALKRLSRGHTPTLFPEGV